MQLATNLLEVKLCDRASSSVALLGDALRARRLDPGKSGDCLVELGAGSRLGPGWVQARSRLGPGSGTPGCIG